MKMVKKIVLCVSAAAISSFAYADIIELDALNPDHCRQQILKSVDQLPVIAAYTSDSHDTNSAEFMKKFEVLAANHPDKTFFKWDVKKDILHATKTLCLQQLGLSVPPNLLLVGVFKLDEERTFMSAPLRLSWAGEMTMPEMEQFINTTDLNMKKAVLAQKNFNK